MSTGNGKNAWVEREQRRLAIITRIANDIEKKLESEAVSVQELNFLRTQIARRLLDKAHGPIMEAVFLQDTEQDVNRNLHP